MDQIFYFVLNMSIIASVIGVVLLTLRKIHKIRRGVLYFLWLFVALRLMIPFTFTSDFSALHLLHGLIKRVVKVPIQMSEQVQMNLTMSNSIGVAETYFPITYKADWIEVFFKYLSWGWFIGTIIALVLVIVLYSLTAREYKDAVQFQNNIYVHQSAKSPFLMGILKPKIIIPENIKFQEEMLYYVLQHEEVHIRRRDNLLRMVGIVIACLHWFNPLVWIFLKCFFVDLEFTCDQHVIRNLSPEQRKKYACALLDLNSPVHPVLLSAFGNSRLKCRIEGIMSYKREHITGVIFSVLFIFTLGIAVLSNPS